MSDTVKLIIEIPKEMMKALEVGNFDSKYNPYDVCWQVRNGIPLDDVKAEIEKNCDRINSIASILSYPQHREIQELLCEILDNIGKAESEE